MDNAASKLVQEVLKRYGLGRFKGIEPINYGGYQAAYSARTTKGRYFVKRYKFRFTKRTREGFGVMEFLLGKGYPCLKAYRSKEGRYYTTVKGKRFAIFEWLGTKPEKINARKARNAGEGLAKLHVLTRNYNEPRYNDISLGHFLRTFTAHAGELKRTPSKTKALAVLWLYGVVKRLRLPKSLPKAINHGEFTSEHLHFQGNKLSRVLDLDMLATRDYAFLDLGTLAVESFVEGKLNFNILASLISGYNSVRRLSPWERSHIFAMVAFGIFKFQVWQLQDIRKWGWKGFGTRAMDLMQKRNIFNEELSKRLRV